MSGPKKKPAVQAGQKPGAPQAAASVPDAAGSALALASPEAPVASGAAPAPQIVTVGVLSLAQRGLRFVGALLRSLGALVVASAIKVVAFCENWLLDGAKAPHGLAVTRIMFGIAGLGLLLSNWSTRLYAFGPGSMWNGEYAVPGSDFPDIWIFSLYRTVATNSAAYTACYVLLMVLAVFFTLGWRFKLVLPIYFVLWISFIEANDMLGDQGDNMYRIALILLFFADPVRVWSLDARRRRAVAAKPGGSWLARKWAGEPLLQGQPEYRSLFNNLALVALTAQVCFVYASGALYKAGGKPWQEGWAVYDPLHTVQFGTWPELSDLVTAWGPAVVVAGWGSIILQMCFPMMLLTHSTRVIALVGIMGFHLGIAVLMGLPWFSLTMIAIDFVFITEKTWAKAISTVRDAWSRAARAA